MSTQTNPDSPAAPDAPQERRVFKPTKAELIMRVTEVYKLLVFGFARHQIMQYISEKTIWNVTERTMDAYIARANALFEAQAKVLREAEFGKALARLDDIYGRTHRIQDYKTALAAQRERNDLLGLYPAKRRHEDDEETDRTIAILVTPGRAETREQWQQYVQEQQQLLAPPASTP